jgi:RNA polymerase sigma-70 factor (ECF subfamily)
VPPTATADLLARARTGDPHALNVLCERVAPRLLSYIRLRMGRELRARHESRDLLQGSLIKAVQKIGQFRGGETPSLMAWLTRIADHEMRDAFDHLHRQRRDAARETAVDEETPMAAVSRSVLSRLIIGQEAERLEAAIESLSPDHRDVILMRKFEELSFAEIAQRMGRGEDACRMLLARAMTALTLKLTEMPR